MRIKITQAHIDQGKPRFPFECPVAIAINEAIPAGAQANVMSTLIWLALGGERVCVCLAEEAELFIDAYDDGLSVEPFEFELEVTA